MMIDAAHAYLRSIRKPSKRAYAEQYWRWLVETTCTSNRPDAPEPSNLGVMAAQAVRMRLQEFTR